MMLFISTVITSAENVTVETDTIFNLSEVSVSGLYRNNVTTGSLISQKTLQSVNIGQGPDYVLSTLPNIYAYNDNGTHMGYTYFRMRGMGQERINFTLDGVSWSESEDFGCYFSNSPDLMSSMHSIKAERGASVTSNGTAAYAGNVSLESVDLKNDTDSYVDVGGGSFNSFRTTAVYNMGIKNGWGLHIRATQQQTDGYKVNTSNNSQAFTLKTGYFFNDNHSIDFMTMTGFHRNGQGYMGITEDMIPAHPTPFKQMISGNYQQETDNFLTTYNRIQYKGKFADKTFFTSTLYWQHQTGDYRIKWDNGDGTETLNNYHLNYNMYGANAVVKYYPLDNLSLTGGVNAYWYSRKHSGFDINPDSIINIWHQNGKEPYYVNRGNKPDVNVFGSVKYEPVDNLHFGADIQYRHTSLDYHAINPIDNNDNDFFHAWNFLNYGLYVSYDITRNSQVYARYNVTNREPSRTDLLAGEWNTGEFAASFDNERVNDVELGYEIRNKKIAFNANAFYMNFNNELVSTGELSPTNFLPLHVQHDAYRYGIELATDYNLVSTLHIIANVAWSKNKIKNINGNDVNSTFSPDWTLFSEINYTVNKIKFGLNCNYRSSVYMDIENAHKLKDNFSLNAYVNARVSKTVELGANLTNITNRLNFSQGSVADGVAFYNVDAPFMMMFNAKFHF